MFSFIFGHAVRHVGDPRPGIEALSPALEAWRLELLVLQGIPLSSRLCKAKPSRQKEGQGQNHRVAALGIATDSGSRPQC